METQQKLRVMLVDDSGVVRRMVAHVLAKEPDIDVVAEAAHGVEALTLLADEALRVDLLVLDVEMPEMDGLGVLRRLAGMRPTLPVVMFTAETARAADLTLEALTLGARDFARKPRASDGGAGSAQVRKELVERIRLHGRPKAAEVAPPAAHAGADPGSVGDRTAPTARSERQTSATGNAQAPRAPLPDSPPAVEHGRAPRSAPEDRRPAQAAPRPQAAPRSGAAGPPAGPLPSGGSRARASLRERGPIELVVLGCSTGGPVALSRLLNGLPTLPVPVLVVQHMPPVFTQRLAERLDAETAHRVAEAQGGEVLEPGQVWIAQGDRHLTVVREGKQLVTKLTQGPLENFCRPAVDVLFRSAALATGARTLAVVMTGMGDDGAEGAQVLVDAGAHLIAQDRETSVVWGMPGELARRGLPAEFFPLQELAGAIHARVLATRNRAESQR
ncbi:MAG: chemotaxis-specific protein-glutamate methyltransferase CheB [Planctomycetota bacterium]